MKALVVAILLALTMPASAEDMTTANQMLPACKGYGDNSRLTDKKLFESMWKQWHCLGYLQGLMFGVGGRDFCPPNGVTRGQAIAVVIKYIEARPERMHEEFGVLALEAMMAAWPCKR